MKRLSQVIMNYECIGSWKYQVTFQFEQPAKDKQPPDMQLQANLHCLSRCNPRKDVNDESEVQLFYIEPGFT